MFPWRCARHRFLPAAEDLDDAHGSAAARAWLTQREKGELWLSVLDICLIWWLDAEQRADFGEVGFANTAGQQAVMADAVETARQDMDQESADELWCGKAHDLLAIAVLDAIILPTESDGVGIRADQAVVRDRHPFGYSGSGRQARPLGRQRAAWNRPPIRICGMVRAKR